MKLLRAEEVAVILDVSRSTARRMMIDGTLPAITLRSGKRKKISRVRESELERYVLSLERQSLKPRRTSLAVTDGDCSAN
jgi:excisionase family DNA binding protein